MASKSGASSIPVNGDGDGDGDKDDNGHNHGHDLIDGPLRIRCRPTTPPRKRGFFDLPLELREDIYGYLLLTSRTKVYNSLLHPRYKLHLALIGVNRQVHDEAQVVFSRNQFVLIQAWPKFKGNLIIPNKFPLVSEDAQAKAFRQPHLTVALQYGTCRCGQTMDTYVSCAEDVAQFCRLLYFFDRQKRGFCRGLSLSLTIQDWCEGRPTVSSRAMQESLLMPFALLKDLASFQLHGSNLDLVEEKLIKAMKVPNPTTTDLLESAIKWKLEGNAAFKNGDYALSIQKYTQAYASMETVVSGPIYRSLLDGWFAHTPLTGKLADQRGDLLRHQLGSQLNWNILQAYLSLQDWRKAYLWGERAISDIEFANVHQRIHDGDKNLITEAEKAKVYLRMMIACQKIGNHAGAEECFNKATMYAPSNSAISFEIKKMRRGMT